MKTQDTQTNGRGDSAALLTEDQIERRVERRTDSLDASFMEGRLTQEQYDAEVKALDQWSQEQFDKIGDARRLAAAAPAMLEALSDLLAWAQIPDNGSKDAVILRDAARAAIAQATGTTD